MAAPWKKSAAFEDGISTDDAKALDRDTDKGYKLVESKPDDKSAYLQTMPAPPEKTPKDKSEGKDSLSESKLSTKFEK